MQRLTRPVVVFLALISVCLLDNSSSRSEEKVPQNEVDAPAVELALPAVPLVFQTGEVPRSMTAFAYLTLGDGRRVVIELKRIPVGMFACASVFSLGKGGRKVVIQFLDESRSFHVEASVLPGQICNVEQSIQKRLAESGQDRVVVEPGLVRLWFSIATDAFEGDDGEFVFAASEVASCWQYSAVGVSRASDGRYVGCIEAIGSKLDEEIQGQLRVSGSGDDAVVKCIAKVVHREVLVPAVK